MLFVKSAPPSGGRGGAVNNGGDQPPPFSVFVFAFGKNFLFTLFDEHLT